MPHFDMFGIPILSGDLGGDPLEDRLDVVEEQEEQEREDEELDEDEDADPSAYYFEETEIDCSDDSDFLPDGPID